VAVPAKPYLAPPYFPPAPTDASVRVIPIRAYYQARPYTCGFASTLTVLHAYRRYVPAQQAYEKLGTDFTGTSQTAIVRALRDAGIGASLRYDLSFDDMARAIDAGKLIISYHFPLEHWVVIYGYGRDPDRVFVADSLPHNRSEQPWSHYGEKLRGFGIVCNRRRRGAAEGQAPTLKPTEIIEEKTSAAKLRRGNS